MQSPAPTNVISRILSPLPQQKSSRRSLVLPTSHLPEEAGEEDARSARQRRHSRGFSRVITPSKEQVAQESRPHLPWSQDQLKQHYSQCMKLSQENKINHKNAFELQLIEHMSEMIHKDGDLNFRTAGGTIYAGAKIYASRVDAIYSEIYRVMNSLGGGEKEDKEDMDELNDSAQGGDNELKTKRRKKNSKILETNVSNLLVANILVPTAVDVLDRTHTVIDAASCDSLKLNSLNVAHNETVLYDNQLQQFSSQQELPPVEEVERNILEEATKSSSVDLLAGGGQLFAETLKELDFDIADLVSSNPLSQDLNTDGESPPGESPGGGFEFEDDGGGCHDDDDVVVGDGDHTVGIVDEVFTAHQQQMSRNSELSRNIELSHHEHKLSMCLASSPGEYSYFNPNILAAFDSSAHWKRSRVAKPVLTDNNLPGILSEVPSQAKKCRKSAKHDLEAGALVHDKKLQPQKVSRQKRAALKAEMSNNRVMQRSGNDRRAFTRAVSVKVRLEPLTNNRLLSHSEAIETNHFEYNNEDYCPALSQSDHGDDDVFENTGFPDASKFSPTQDAPPGYHDDTPGYHDDDYRHLLDGDHLVSQPRKVEKILVTFSKRAKHIDVRKLKTAMWDLLKPSKPNDSNQTKTSDGDVTENEIDDTTTNADDVIDGSEEDKGILFSEVYKQLPSKMSEKMAENLSPHLAFTCLLHLANEKGLKIVGKSTLSDLTITHEF